MKLHEAFICLQPIAPNTAPRDRLRLQQAARLMLDALNAQARIHLPRSRYSPSDRDTAVQTVLFRMIKAGPRGARAGDPTSDEAVSRWLGRAIKNAATDQHRRQRRHTEADAGLLDRRAHAAHGNESGGTRQVSRQRMNEAVANAEKRLLREIVPAVVARKRRSSKAAGDRFAANITTLRKAVAAGDSVVDVAWKEVAAELQEAGEKPDKKRHKRQLTTRRTALDKRFQRVREHVIAEIDRQREGGTIDRRERAIMLLLVQQRLYLQRRQDAVIARAHLKAPSGAH